LFLAPLVEANLEGGVGYSVHLARRKERWGG